MTTIEDIVVQDLVDRPELERLENGFRLRVSHGLTDLTFEPCQAEPGDFGLSKIARVTTFFERGMPQFDETGIALLNRRAAFGSFSLIEESVACELSFSIYDREPADRWVAHILLTALGEQLAFGIALGQSEITEDLLRGNRANLGYPRDWVTPPDPAEVEADARQFTEHGYVSTQGAHGLVSEVRLSDGAPSRMIDPAAETALLHVSVDTPHPLAGVGYVSTIALPIDPESASIPRWCAFLNKTEHQQQDFVPRLGAWGMRGHRDELVYSMFWPTPHASSGIQANMMNWMIQRTLWLRETLWKPAIGLAQEVPLAA